jgi:hypothetical protein
VSLGEVDHLAVGGGLGELVHLGDEGGGPAQRGRLGFRAALDGHGYGHRQDSFEGDT